MWKGEGELLKNLDGIFSFGFKFEKSVIYRWVTNLRKIPTLVFKKVCMQINAHTHTHTTGKAEHY